MKTHKLIKLISILTLSALTIAPASAITTAEKREIYNKHKGAVFGVKGTLKITATVQGKIRTQEAKIWSNATCIADKILVAAYESISPNVGGNNPNVQVSKSIEQLKIITAKGTEFDAKLILHDEDLGLAFIAIDPKTKNIKSWKNQIVNTTKDITLQHLDETINISRYASHLNHHSAATLGTVSAIITKPRRLYQILSASMSAPSFNHAGEFVGITVTQTPTTKEKQAIPPVTIPAKYINKLLKLAKTKQKQLK